MLETLQFIFSSFWVWIGCFILVMAVGEAAALVIAAMAKKR